MAIVTANGQAAFDVQVARPRVGAWHVDMRVDAPDALTGKVTLVVGGATMVGTVRRSAEFVETSQAQVVGGNGGLGVSASPRHYNGASVGIILRDVLASGGEALSSTADQAVLGVSVPSWTTLGRPVGAVIADLINTQVPGAAWRVLDDGTIWVGRETWPDAGLQPTDFALVDQFEEEAKVIVKLEQPLLRPGTTFLGRRVAYVQDDVPHKGSLETTVWFEDADVVEVGRLRAGLGALVRGSPREIDYRARYWAVVVQQSGSTIHVQPEDSRLPDMGEVQLVNPPGESVDSIVGGRVLVGWAGADPSKAYAESFDGGEVVTKKVIAAVQAFLGEEAGAEPTYRGLSQNTAWATFFTAFATYLAGIQTIADPGSPPGTFTGPFLAAIAALQVALASSLTTNARVR